VTSIVVDSETLDKVERVKNKIGEVDFVFCSPMRRAKQTADLIFGKGNYKTLHFIKEYGTPKEIIGKPRKFAIDFWEVKHKKDKMDVNWIPSGGESFTSVAHRAEELY
jgi:broad specificity phosphatase PhoE